jgi:hypothetical protein
MEHAINGESLPHTFANCRENGTPPSRANAHSRRDVVMTTDTAATKYTNSAPAAMAFVAPRLRVARKYMAMKG